MTLITGGSGFLGRYIARRLLAKGEQVILFNRSAPPADLDQAQWFKGDINDTQALTTAMRGCDTVFHTAAVAGVWGSEDLFHTVNVLGTQSVLDACKTNKVKKLIYTSSPSVVFGTEAIENGDEDLPYPESYLTTYPKSKAEGERLVLIANSSDFKTCSLRPHLIWGPEDQHLIPRLIHKAKSGRLRQVGKGDNLVDLTYVDNAAKAHIQASEALDSTGRPAGKAYFISDPAPVNLWNWIEHLLKESSIPFKRRALSYNTAKCIGSVLEIIYRGLKLSGEPPMTRFVAAQLAKAHYFNNDAARNDFNYAPEINNEQGLVATLKWLRDTKQVK